MRHSCRNCGAMLEVPEPVYIEVEEEDDPGLPLSLPSSITRKSVRLVSLLWAACREGGVTRPDASEIVAPGLDGHAGLRKLRRYMRDLRDLGLVVEQEQEQGGSRVLSIAVRGVDFRIWRSTL